mmetsp:Transcript_20443/g.26355  ORF Transcript_20443/g.26355 Transcript_20443/m.26355 type:complete len:176 (-) Transcript_20443:97-624(-)
MWIKMNVTNKVSILFILVVGSTAFLCDSSVTVASRCQKTLAGEMTYASSLRNSPMDGNETTELSRRRLFANLFSAALLSTAASSPATAADEVKKTVYLTGKSPQVPGQKPKDKNDTSGTRRDPSFLRSLSDCKSQCENKVGPDGFFRPKEDCLSECQDICCATYEQCTFGIVPRI